MGLITNHAYSVIGTAVLKKPNGNEIQLLKMKNIWGTNEWIGDWSDQSLKWTQEFKKAVGLQNKEDGVFWMSYDDYLQFYTTTHIAQVHSDYTYKVVKMKNKEAQNICKITTDKNGSGYFMVNLKNSNGNYRFILERIQKRQISSLSQHRFQITMQTNSISNSTEMMTSSMLEIHLFLCQDIGL
jgi:calpain-15